MTRLELSTRLAALRVGLTAIDLTRAGLAQLQDAQREVERLIDRVSDQLTVDSIRAELAAQVHAAPSDVARAVYRDLEDEAEAERQVAYSGWVDGLGRGEL